MKKVEKEEGTRAEKSLRIKSDVGEPDFLLAGSFRDVAYWQILLQKSKIERR
jgi:hypothetical protein